jgi:hypothetical protein
LGAPEVEDAASRREGAVLKWASGLGVQASGTRLPMVIPMAALSEVTFDVQSVFVSPSIENPAQFLEAHWQPRLFDPLMPHHLHQDAATTISFFRVWRS